jgi:hypothetical protein
MPQRVEGASKMSEFGDVTSAVLAQLGRLTKGMSDEDMKRVASGEAKLVLLQPGTRVVEHSPALEQTLKFLQKLGPDELHQLNERLLRLALLRKGDSVLTYLDPSEIATRVAELQTEDEIVRYLDADSRLTGPKLKLVAAELRIDVPAAVKSKPALQLHIAQQTLQDRRRWSWR